MLSGIFNKGNATKVRGADYLDAHQYSLILPQNGGHAGGDITGIQQGTGLQKHPPSKTFEAIALSNRIIKATESGDGFRVRINLDIPICLTRDEVERLIEVTDDWPGWCDSPRHCLSELGLKLEQAIAMVRGAK